MRQTWDIPSELESSEFRACHLDEVILSLAREIAMDRVRRRIRPRQYQMHELYVVRAWPMRAVMRFLNVTALQLVM